MFTPDGKFVVFAKAPLRADTDKARRAKKKPEEMPKAGLGIIDLTNSRVTTLAEHVKSFRLPDDPVKIVVFLIAPPETVPLQVGKKHDVGTDLVIRDLASGKDQTIREVSEYAVSRDGSAIAYSVSSKAPGGDGAFVRRTADGSTKTLITGVGTVQRLRIRRQSHAARLREQSRRLRREGAALQALSRDDELRLRLN